MASDLAERSEESESPVFNSFEILKNLHILVDKKRLKEPLFTPPNSKFLLYGRSINKLTVLISDEGVPLITSYYPESRRLAEEIKEIFETFKIQVVLRIVEAKKS